MSGTEIERMLFWIGHASFYIKGKERTVFIDPFGITDRVTERADIILITHAHFDHCVRADIERVSKPDTRIIAAKGCDLEGLPNVTVAAPGFSETVEGVGIEAVPSYNTYPEKQGFHPKSNGWVGYIVKVDGTTFYHAGDTDLIPEMRELKQKHIDVALLPIGGKYTMDLQDAIKAAEEIGARHTVPMHFRNLLGEEGSKRAIEEFRSRVKGTIVLTEIQEPTYHF